MFVFNCNRRVTNVSMMMMMMITSVTDNNDYAVCCPVCVVVVRTTTARAATPCCRSSGCRLKRFSTEFSHPRPTSGQLSESSPVEYRSVVRYQGQSGQATQLFQATPKISFTFHFRHKSFILDDVKLAELSDNSFE